MKPASFRYHAPKTIEEALAMLAEYAPDDGRVLAGGQSLVPTMAFRLARPHHLVDINGIADLRRLASENGRLAIGAGVRHQAFHRPVVAAPLGDLLAAVMRHIAHYPIRARGTFCGSVAHADPASEWCLVAATLDAELVIASRRGTRALRADAFFVTALTTALEPDELLSEIRLPLLDAGWQSGFAEFSRRAGDYALAMCAAFLRVEDGRVVEARVGIGGATDRPTRIAAAEAALIGSDGGAEIRREAGDIAADAIDPLEDV